MFARSKHENYGFGNNYVYQYIDIVENNKENRFIMMLSKACKEDEKLFDDYKFSKLLLILTNYVLC